MFERITGLGTCIGFSADENRIVFVGMRKLMNFLDYEGMELQWASGLVDTGIQAAFRWQEPNSIFVRPPSALAVKVPQAMQYEYKQSTINLMLPSIVHELVHRRQFREQGKLKYWVKSIPGLYYRCLDAEAFEAERKAAEKLGLKQGEYDTFGKGGRG